MTRRRLVRVVFLEVLLMFEMTGAGKHHGYFVLVSRLQDFLIANGTARGNDGCDSIFTGRGSIS